MTKLAILFVFALSMQSFANGYGQDNITLKLEKVQLKNVFKAIEEQGVFRFVYKDDILPKGQRINIRVKHAYLEDVLKKILENTSLSYYRLSDNLIVITRETAGDDKKTALVAVHISGRVTNEKGDGLSGVTILEKGTNNGTATKEDGAFSMDVTSLNAVLVFSSIGFGSQEYSIKGKAVVNIKL
ncbi:MAG TPA: carboxypeptidase-like regulatory domain-containing protein, partial [Puia sp.]|nr:carboxypeptidase-like regulatory domain-containing protein [Puia sp.]